jgi:Glycine zipper 2TM domain
MMFKHCQVSRIWLAGLPVLAVAAALAGCGERNASSGAPAANSATEADVSSENELRAREEELARREAEVAAKEHEQELARQKAEADAAAAQAAAEKAAAAKKMAKKPPAAKPPAVVASNAAPAKAVPAKPVEHRVTVPSGTALTMALSSGLSSKTARAGDPFEATLASNLMVNGHRAVPIGTRVTGTITDVISGSRAIGAVPTLGLRFNQLELEDGQIIPITGELVEQGPSEKARDTAKILGGAAAGAVLGHQVKKGSSGKIIGGLLGGAVGAVAAKNTGTEVQLAAGSTLTLTTGEPFTAVVHE